MLSAPALSTTDTSSANHSDGLEKDGDENQRIGPALRQLRCDVAALRSDAGNRCSPIAWRAACRAAAEELGQKSRDWDTGDLAAAVAAVRRELRAAGAEVADVLPEDLELARQRLKGGWSGVLGAMLLAPSWLLPEAPLLRDVPDWLWGAYAEWIFEAPESVDTAMERERLLSHHARHLTELAVWVERNSGSPVVAAAREAYLQAATREAPVPGSAVQSRLAGARARVLRRRFVRQRDDYEPEVAFRDGRKLRVGIVATSFGPGWDLFALLPYFEELDPKGFEVFLFALAGSDSPEAKYCAGRVRGVMSLPVSPQARVESLRQARLDVVVFAGNVGRRVDGVTQLALSRLAPLQVVIDPDGATTGLSTIDVLVTSSAAAVDSGAAERVGRLRGPGRAFAFPCRKACATDRAALGLPSEAPLLVTVGAAADFREPVLALWAAVLARTPDARMAVALLGEENRLAGADEAFAARLEATLSASGVPTERVSVFPVPATPADGYRGLLGMGDVFLGGGALASPLWAAEALQSGKPVVALEGPSADLLRSIGLSEWVAADAAGFVAIASRLAGDPALRKETGDRVVAAIETGAPFLDSLAASDAFGVLLETAFDELVSLGSVEFRAQREDLACFAPDDPASVVESGLAALENGDIDTAAFDSLQALRADPSHSRARFLRGQVLRAQGEPSRAVDYLAAAVHAPDATPAVWFALAQALRDNRQYDQAIEVLSVCVRLDPKPVEPLLVLLELAEAVGATEIAKDVAESLQQVAPDDPRVLALS